MKMFVYNAFMLKSVMLVACAFVVEYFMVPGKRSGKAFA